MHGRGFWLLPVFLRFAEVVRVQGSGFRVQAWLGGSRWGLVDGVFVGMGEERELPWGVYDAPNNKCRSYVARFRFEGVSVYLGTRYVVEEAAVLAREMKELSVRDRVEFLRLYPGVVKQLENLRKRKAGKRSKREVNMGPVEKPRVDMAKVMQAVGERRFL